MKRRSRLSKESRDAARAIGLTYVNDRQPGYHRQRHGRSFCYTTSRGSPVREPRLRERFKALAIPPAWSAVWICKSSTGHLQATGIDARGRKQYRYHAKWRKIRSTYKFQRLSEFGQALPRIRRQVRNAMKLPGLPREKIVASAIRILDHAGIRIGNREYAHSNGSFGLTTLRNRHLMIRGDALQLQFRGKSGVHQEIEFEDARLARIMRRCSELPGQALFQYLDQDGKVHSIDSSHVNSTIRQWTDNDFTARDFRTWAGSMAFLHAVLDHRHMAKRDLNEAIEQVAQTLGNTPGVCRKHYIHPCLIDSYDNGTLIRHIARMGDVPRSHGLRTEERLLLRLLEKLSGAKMSV